MAFQTRKLMMLAGVLVTLGVAVPASAQTEITNDFKFNSGQDVQPVFEGWSKSPDGSFVMHFGYLNRNWAQDLSIPIGPANNIEPGGPDRGSRPSSRRGQSQPVHRVGAEGFRQEGIDLDADRQRQDGKGVRLARSLNGRSIRGRRQPRRPAERGGAQEHCTVDHRVGHRPDCCRRVRQTRWRT